jgi:predicted nucleic acid-binding protein
MILLAKHDALHLLESAYIKVAVPTSIIEVIDSTALDKGISEGWLELFDPDIDHVMRVDEIESRSGLKLSVYEEACIALALQLRADAILTLDREVQAAAKLLGIRVDGIPSLLLAASRSGSISKEEGMRLFHKICNEIVPGLGVEVSFQNSPRWQTLD